MASAVKLNVFTIIKEIITSKFDDKPDYLFVNVKGALSRNFRKT